MHHPREQATEQPAAGASRRDRLLGARLGGGYRLVSRIATGGLSAVFRAEDAGGRVAAAKVLDALYADLAPLRQRLAREAEVAERLDGQGAPRLLGDGTVLGQPYLLFELVEGESLAARLRRGALSAREAVDVCVAILRALACAHRLDVLHLDVKPANVMLAPGGDVKLLDFSSAPRAEPDGSYPGADTEPLGTPAYCSPEQVEERPLDTRSDLYSVGVVLFELLAGERPFRGDPVEVLRAHVDRPAPPVRLYRPELSAALGGVVARALAKPARERFPDAASFIAALGDTEEARR